MSSKGYSPSSLLEQPTSRPVLTTSVISAIALRCRFMNDLQLQGIRRHQWHKTDAGSMREDRDMPISRQAHAAPGYWLGNVVQSAFSARTGAMNHTSPSLVHDNSRFYKLLLIFASLLLAGCSYVSTRSVDDVLEGVEARGRQQYGRGNFERAREDWQHGLQLAEQHGRSDMQARFLTNLARVDEESGKYQEAWQQAARAVEVARSIPSDSLESYALVEVAQAQRRLSQYTAAKQNLEAA